jgi:predicted nucleic acid-binding protein
MTTLLFPDNTVLVNFALINRVDVLQHIMSGRAAWCATVASECRRSAAEPGLELMTDYADTLGAPLYPETQAEHLQVQLLRDELAIPGDPPTRHLGEAETLALIIGRNLEAVFVTDDQGARRLAAVHGIRCYTTWDMLKLAGGRIKLIDPDALWGYVQTLRGLGRGGPEGVYDRRSFDQWLG